MKISPMTQSTGTPGQTLNSVDVGRTASPIKLERARAIARGEKVEDVVADPQADRIQDVRRLKMKTNFSTNREMPPVDPVVGSGTEVDPTALSGTEVTTEPGAVEDTKPLSPQFAALAKQKRALQLERAEFEKLKSEYQGTAPNDEFITKLKSNPMSVLQEIGVTYDQLTESILAGNEPNPELLALKAKVEALEKGVDTKFQTREQQQEEAALTEMLYEAEDLAKEGEAFEMIRSEEAYDQVLRLIHDTYKQTGRVLDVKAAMDRIESQLFAKAEKFASISKVRNKLSPPTEPVNTRPQGMRTLTARDTASPVQDRRARAIAAMQGTLKR